MRFTTAISAALAAVPVLVSSVAGLPIRRDGNSTANAQDILVLKFANVLEQLESQFYSQALQKFQESDFLNAGFTDASIPVQQFQAISSDESTHTSVLASTIQSLGDNPISGCNFDFSAALTDVATMLPIARLVENVGVGAYLGAADLISDPSILTAAASILTNEARHQTILNVLSGGTAIPQAFDIPLLPPEVLALAGPFISGCDVGIQGLQPLTVTNTGAVVPGTALTFQADTLNGVDPNTLSCQMLAGGMPFSLSLPFSQCVVPDGLVGPVAIYVTNDTQPLANNARDKFLGNVVAGPTMAFIDTQPETLGNLASGKNETVVTTTTSTDSSVATATATTTSDVASSTETGAIINISTSISTSTISPQDASSIIASASGTTLVVSATETASSAASTPTTVANVSNNAASLPPSANAATGPSPDGAITVDGWSVSS